jgi:hypothetical protein
MVYFVAGLAALAIGLLFIKWLTETTPKNIKVVLAFVVFLLFLIASIALFATGRFVLSLPTLVGAFVAYQRYRMVKNLWEKFKGSNQQQDGNVVRLTKLTKVEAAEILGVDVGASEKEIKTAHKTLMKKFHPDQGGNTYQAKEINDAKDVLLK